MFEAKFKVLKKNQSMILAENRVSDYVSLLGTDLSNKKTLGLQEAVIEFIKGKEHSVLLLLGDNGSGKSLFCKRLLGELWEAPEMVSIPIFIDLPHVQNFEQMIEQALIQAGFAQESFDTLKKQQEFVFILDSYESLCQFRNLYAASGLGEWRAKTIITCSNQFLYFLPNYERYFVPFHQGKPQIGLLKQIQIEPLSSELISQVIEKKIQAIGCEPSLQRSLQDCLLNRFWMGNPFFLNALITALPKMINSEISMEGSERINKFFLGELLEHWFSYQSQKLDVKHEDLLVYSQKLALQMNEKSSFVYVPIFSTGLFEKSSTESDNTLANLCSNSSEIMRKRLGCPLIKLNVQEYGFIDSSLVKHFLNQTRAITAANVDEQVPEKPKVFELQYELPSLEDAIHLKSFTRDKGMLEFLAGRLRTEAGLKEELDKIIRASKIDKCFSVGAANVITALNRARFPFSGENFREISIPDADLSNGIFDNTDFFDANLEGVDFQGAWLHNANFQKASMLNVQFGENPFLSFECSVQDFCYSQSGRWLAVASDNVFIFNADNYSKTRTLRNHTAAVYAVAFSPQENYLVSGSFDKTIKLWDAVTWKCLRTFEGHKATINRVAFTKDESQIISTSDDSVLKVWEINSGNCSFEISKGGDFLSQTFIFSPDGQYLAVGREDTPSLQLWGLKNGHYCDKVFDGYTDVITSIVFSPDGGQLVSGCFDGDMRLCDLNNDNSLKLFGHNDKITNIIFYSEGKQFISSSFDGSIRLWELATHQCFRVLMPGSPEDWGTRVVYIPGKNEFASSAGAPKSTIKFWKTENREISEPVYDFTDKVISLSFSPYGMQLVSGTMNGKIGFYETEGGKFFKVLAYEDGRVEAVAHSPDGEYLISSNYDDNICIWETKTAKRLEIIPNTQGTRTIAYSPDGEWLASGGLDESIKIWRVKGGVVNFDKSLSGHIKAELGTVTKLAFFPNEKWLASAGLDKTVRIWDIEDGQRHKILFKCKSSVIELIFSSHGEWLAFSDGTVIKLWAMKNGERIEIFEEDKAIINTLAFSPDGNWLVSGGQNGSIKIYDIKTKQLLATTKLPAAISALCFQKASKNLAIGSSDSAVRYFSLEKDSENKLELQLLWSHPQAFLHMNNAKIESAKISLSDARLLKTKGTVGFPEIFLPVKTSENMSSTQQFELGNCYLGGEIVVRDLKIAAYWFSKAAEQGHMDAQFELAKCYRDRKGVVKDLRTAAHWFMKSAEQGHMNAQFELAKCYRDRKGMVKSLRTAAHWFSKAEKQGHLEAQFELAKCYRDGKGITKDLKTAADFFFKAATEGYIGAQFELGNCYQCGEGFDKNYEMAFRWYYSAAQKKHLRSKKIVNHFFKLAEKGNADMQFALGICFKGYREINKGIAFYVPRNPILAEKWLVKAAAQGHREAQFELGECYRDGGCRLRLILNGVEKFEDKIKAGEEIIILNNKRKVIIFYKNIINGEIGSFNCSKELKKLLFSLKFSGSILAKNQNSEEIYKQAYKEVQLNYGQVTLKKDQVGANGEIVMQDLALAKYWLLKAANQDHLEAQFELGNCYRNGKGVTENLDVAIKWYLKAAKQGLVNAQRSLAICYQDAEDTPQNRKKALDWFTKAAEQGDAEAQYWVGICYLDAQGAPKDLKAAASWFKKAAGQDYVDAQYWLGVFYEHGLGITQDSKKAFKWFMLSKERFLASNYYLGFLHHEGHGVPKSYNKAQEYFNSFFANEEEAKDIVETWGEHAAKGDSLAQFCIGFLYKIGIVHYVVKDLQKGLRWLTEAAKQNNTNAQISLGLCYENGEGVTKDFKIARDYYEKAVRQGNKNAKLFLEMLEIKMNGRQNLFSGTLTGGIEENCKFTASIEEGRFGFRNLLWLWQKSSAASVGNNVKTFDAKQILENEKLIPFHEDENRDTCQKGQAWKSLLDISGSPNRAVEQIAVSEETISFNSYVTRQACKSLLKIERTKQQTETLDETSKHQITAYGIVHFHQSNFYEQKDLTVPHLANQSITKSMPKFNMKKRERKKKWLTKVRG